MSRLVGNLKRVAGRAADGAKRAAGDATDAVKRAAGDATDTAGRAAATAKRAAEDATDAAKRAAEAAAGMARRTGEVVSTSSRLARHGGRVAWGSLRRGKPGRNRQIARAFGQQVKRSPFRTGVDFDQSVDLLSGFIPDVLDAVERGNVLGAAAVALDAIAARAADVPTTGYVPTMARAFVERFPRMFRLVTDGDDGMAAALEDVTELVTLMATTALGPDDSPTADMMQSLAWYVHNMGGTSMASIWSAVRARPRRPVESAESGESQSGDASPVWGRPVESAESQSGDASPVWGRVRAAGATALTAARLSGHAGRTAWGYIRQGEAGGARQLARAAAQQARRRGAPNDVAERLSSHIPAIVAAAGRGDVVGVAEIVLEAVAQEGRHVEPSGYKERLAIRWAMRLPDIFREYVVGDDPSGAAALGEVLDVVGEMAAGPDPDAEGKWTRRLAQAVMLIAKRRGHGSRWAQDESRSQPGALDRLLGRSPPRPPQEEWWDPTPDDQFADWQGVPDWIQNK
jgi:hypothetical protein